ncbi:MAG: alpha/beta hydrolase [Bacilli bacterium]|nr:alpha/beta hydrolase [Bacilli bacterium]
MKPVFIALIVVFVIIEIILFISLYLYFRIFHNNIKGTPRALEPLKGELYVPFEDKSRQLIQEALNIPFEQVYIEPKKGRKLAGRYYAVKEGGPVAIMVHGYKSVGIKDFSGGIKELLAREHNVLIVDHYGHFKSAGKTITFGVREKDDVLYWIDYVNKRLDNPEIYLYGISMGAATVLMDSGMPLPENVKGVIADCPYSSVKEEIKYTVQQMKIPFAPVYPFIYLAALIFARFDMHKGKVKEYIKKTKLPILIIHGTTDDIVPVEHSRKLKEMFPEKITFLEVEGAPHGMSYFVDLPHYAEALDKFLASIRK